MHHRSATAPERDAGCAACGTNHLDICPCCQYPQSRLSSLLGGLLFLGVMSVLPLAKRCRCCPVSAASASLKQTARCAGYEQEARYFEDSVRHMKQCELAERAQLLLQSAHSQQLAHLRQKTLRNLNADMVSRDTQQSFSAAAAR